VLCGGEWDDGVLELDGGVGNDGVVELP